MPLLFATTNPEPLAIVDVVQPLLVLRGKVNEDLVCPVLIKLLRL